MSVVLRDLAVKLVDVALMVLPLVGALCLLAFIWGVAQLFWPGEDIRMREKGRRVVVLSLTFLFLAAALWSILDWAFPAKISEITE